MLNSNSSIDRLALYTSFTAATQNGPSKDVSDFNNVLVMVQGTYATGLTIAWECSMDGITWIAVQGVRTDSAAVSTSQALGVNGVVAFDIYVGPFNYFRVRSTTWASPSGQCDIWCAATECGVDPSLAVTVAGTATVNGGAGHSAATSANPLMIGGQAKSTVDTTLVDGDASFATISTARQLITKPYGSAELDWAYNTQGLTTTTTAAAAKGAGAASVRNYVTGIQAINTSATATKLLIQDGASTIWGIQLPANMTSPIEVEFPTPLRGTAATALNYNFSVAGATVDINIQGYQNF